MKITKLFRRGLEHHKETIEECIRGTDTPAHRAVFEQELMLAEDALEATHVVFLTDAEYADVMTALVFGADSYADASRDLKDPKHRNHADRQSKGMNALYERLKESM